MTDRQVKEARELLDEVKGQSQTIIGALRRYRWFLALTVLLVLAVGVLGWSTHKNSQCNSRWANAYTRRAATLTDLSSTRTDALDVLLRDAFVANPDKAKLAADAQNYVKVSNAYKQALVDHPIPPSPANHCSVF